MCFELNVFEKKPLSINEYINVLLYACTLLEADSCWLYFLLKKRNK